MNRANAICAAFVVGWIVYMVAMMMTVYDGALSAIFQPFIAAICSTIVVIAAILAGLILRLPFLSRLWNGTTAWAIALIVCSLFILCFGYHLGIVGTYTDPETDHQVQGLPFAAGLSSYFALLFAIANWPTRKVSGANDTPDRPTD